MFYVTTFNKICVNWYILYCVFQSLKSLTFESCQKLALAFNSFQTFAIAFELF